MSLYPLFADLKGRPVLVVGGGEVARRKVAALLRTGADIRVGAPQLCEALAEWATAGRVRQLAGEFVESWLDDVWLVIAATDDATLNVRIAAAADARRVLANVVDDAELSRFHVPAVVDRSPLMIAISSAGTAPVLARRVRERLETWLEPSLGALAALAGRQRRRIRGRHPHMAERRDFYDWLLDGPVAGLLRSGHEHRAEQALAEALQAPAAAETRGHVSLVGAGPGDPGLLTLAALRALNRADVILHDRLVDARILDLARRDAVPIDVGKRVGENHEATQQRIHRLCLEHAQAGQRVVRLKGGDPFIFGRGGEELEFLRAHDVDYDVVPGISAAVACAAYAGVPLTHRGHAQSVHLTTIGRKQALDDRDWAALARPAQTVAIYMGVAKLPRLTERLLAHGRAADTPFALVENGTRPEQRVLTGALAELPALARQHQIKPPALLILGEVAALAPRLEWFGERDVSAAQREVA